MRWIGLIAATAACSGGKATEEEFVPALEFLSPTENETLPAGDVAVSIVVTDFELTAPDAAARLTPLPLPFLLLEPTALAHNEDGMPAGYVELTLDGDVVGTMDGTQFTLVGVTAGLHALVGELMYADGDSLEEPVVVPIAFIAE